MKAKRRSTAAPTTSVGTHKPRTPKAAATQPQAQQAAPVQKADGRFLVAAFLGMTT
ncbi:MAG TPA: hypothetical protein VJN21_06955 [Candidatus Acidoferrales bacterium]|nr:hypothetical protein [Candidatus Acidoferrales bacterium]